MILTLQPKIVRTITITHTHTHTHTYRDIHFNNRANFLKGTKWKKGAQEGGKQRERDGAKGKETEERGGGQRGGKEEFYLFKYTTTLLVSSPKRDTSQTYG